MEKSFLMHIIINFKHQYRCLSLSIKSIVAYSYPPAPGDYTALNSTVVFPAGKREHIIAIEIVDDSVLEEAESFTVQLSPLSSGVRIDDGMTSVVIRDDDSKYTLETTLLKI